MVHLLPKLEGTPVVTSISPNNIDSDSNPLPQNITITGNNFQSGATVTFIDSAGVAVNSTSVTFNSATSLTAAVPPIQLVLLNNLLMLKLIILLDYLQHLLMVCRLVLLQLGLQILVL